MSALISRAYKRWPPTLPAAGDSVRTIELTAVAACLV